MNAVMTAVTLWVVPPSRYVKIRVQRTSKRIPERPETKKRRSTQCWAVGAGAAMWVTRGCHRRGLPPGRLLSFLGTGL